MRVFSAKDAEAFVETGETEFVFNRKVQVTPGARDVFSAAGVKLKFTKGQNTSADNFHPHTSTRKPGNATMSTTTKTGSSGAKKPGGNAARPAARKASSSGSGSKGKWERLFHTPEAQAIKEQICDIGRRLWAREYVDGNGGNISARLEDVFLCTPTGVSKGFLKPEMICLVDIDGNQLAGTWKRTSEITTHMAIYRNVAEAAAVVHAHPVHATAFAIAGVEPPSSLIPEMEVFVGRAPIAPYRTPGSPSMADVIGPLSPQHQSILMGNHGVICWGSSVEDAHFKMEITDAYCRTLVIASHIPGAHGVIPCDEVQKLLEMKQGLGLPDHRLNALSPQPSGPPTAPATAGAVCETDPWATIKNRPQACASPAVNSHGQTMHGHGSGASASGDLSQLTNAELEQLVKQITQRVMAAL